MQIYFAGSIRGGRQDTSIYAELVEYLEQYGEVLSEHVGDSELSKKGEDGPNDEYIYDRDLEWLKDADVVVAEVTTPSLGVGYELAKAEQYGKKTICLFRNSADQSLSAMVSGNRDLDVKRYEDPEDVKQLIDSFMDGLD